MNVSSLGGAASLPVPLPLPAAAAAAAAPGAASGSSAPAIAGSKAGPADSVAGPSANPGTGTPPSPAGELRLPGQHASRSKEPPRAAVVKEIPKPAPLPPLKGLTVAEIRAMLGVGRLPSGTATAAAVTPAAEVTIGTAGASPSGSLQSAISRYA